MTLQELQDKNNYSTDKGIKNTIYMKIEVYAICYNEEVRLPYFLRHYSQFADIIVYDNQSTDRSLNIMRGKAKVISYDTNNKLRDDVFLEIKNNCWKGSKADWVIVCDIDELVYHPLIELILLKSEATIFQPKLFNMFSEKLPTTKGQIYEEIQYGTEDDRPKMLVFRPDQIKEINFLPGCHEANPTGNIVLSKELITLHYQFLSRQFTIDRYKEFSKRLSVINRENGWSFHYDFKKKEINNLYDSQNLIKVI